ncbi:hypothetical protein [endosymbiont DhMRE of Dentiscutata heterogama]|uniref:hypothetical protein n=1 Tax=endosymbiont DhMRE of Dentiscutata heterogama TaxID=1609546 RepID=UPI002AD42EBC|nr:hypothetical protein [endosymbiont DhMRE of Dentiscutata heterogama]
MNLLTAKAWWNCWNLVTAPVTSQKISTQQLLEKIIWRICDKNWEVILLIYGSIKVISLLTENFYQIWTESNKPEKSPKKVKK